MSNVCCQLHTRRGPAGAKPSDASCSWRHMTKQSRCSCNAAGSLRVGSRGEAAAVAAAAAAADSSPSRA